MRSAISRCSNEKRQYAPALIQILHLLRTRYGYSLDGVSRSHPRASSTWSSLHRTTLMMASIACSLHLRPTCVLTPSRTLGVDPLSCYLLHQGICPRDNNHIREPHCSSDGNSYQCPQNPSDLHEQCNNLFLEQDTRAFVVSLFESTPPLLNSLQD